MTPEELAKLLPKETIDKLYSDALSGPARQVGKLGTDVMNVARLLLLPLQALGALQDRIEPMFDRIRQRVPEERQIEAPAQITGPILEQLQYLPERSELWQMYEEILTKAVDRDNAGKIHPAFAHIISQLSRDEAWIVYRLRDRTFNVVDTLDFVGGRFENRRIEKSELPTDELHLPEQIDLYYSHLESLALVTWPVSGQEAILDGGRQTGVRRRSTMKLTDFGQLSRPPVFLLKGFDRFGLTTLRPHTKSSACSSVMRSSSPQRPF